MRDHHRSTLALRVLFVVSCILLSVCEVYAWNFDLKDFQRGTCIWYQYAPACIQPPACAAITGAPVDPNPPTNQASPITFTAGMLATPAKLPPLCINRFLPLVTPNLALAPGEFITASVPQNSSSTSRAEVGPGGNLVGYCTDYDPLFVRVEHCVPTSSTPTDYDAELTAELGIPLNTVMEVMSIQIYNGILHEWPTNGDYPTDEGKEVQVLMRYAEPTGINPDSDVDSSSAESYFTSAFSSQCFDARKERRPAEVILSFVLMPSVSQSTINVSIVTRLLDAVVANIDAVKAGNGVVVTYVDGLPLLPFDLATSQDVPIPYVSYVGTNPQPPCSPNVTHIALVSSVEVPADVINYISTVSAQGSSNVGAVSALRPTTIVGRGQLYQRAITWALQNQTVVVVEVSTHDYTTPLIVLAFVDSVLIVYIIILLFARFDWISWPTVLGGLNHPVQFYSRSYTEAEHLRKAGILEDEPPASSSTPEPEEEESLESVLTTDDMQPVMRPQQ